MAEPLKAEPSKADLSKTERAKSEQSTPQAVELHARALLFDMDGILISSIGSVDRSWTKWCELRGLQPEAALSIVHGCRALDTLKRLEPNLSEAELQCELKIIEDLEVADTEGLQVLPGVLALLAALPAGSWTVVTSATERLARVRLAAGGLPVPERIITGDDVPLGKPHPDPYLAGARLLGVPPAECIVFEDAASGVQAGHSAGCTVVATTFSHPLQALSLAHYRVAGLSQLQLIAAGNGHLHLRLGGLLYESAT